MGRRRDDDDMHEAGHLQRGAEAVLQQGAPADLDQGLGQVGPESAARPGGHDDDGDAHEVTVDAARPPPRAAVGQ